MSAELKLAPHGAFPGEGQPPRRFDPPPGEARATAESPWVAQIDVIFPESGQLMRHPAVPRVVAEELLGRGAFAYFRTPRLLSVTFAVADASAATDLLLSEVGVYLKETLGEECTVTADVLEVPPVLEPAAVATRSLRLIRGGHPD